MRRLGLMVLVALLLGIESPRQSASVKYVRLEQLVIPISPGTRWWLGLWGEDGGVVRAFLTEPPSPRLARMYAQVLRDIGLWRLPFQEPVLIQTNSTAVALIPDPPLTYYGCYFPDGNFILVDTRHTDDMTDGELRVLLAHEIGHGVDAQTHRVGHWAFDQTAHLDEQAFADYIAQLVVGSDELRAFQEKYGVIPRRTAHR